VGTISIEKSEVLSKMLTREGIKHHVLNAKHHEREAEIIAQAGQRGAVTISTNMAGRGTDIKLGPGVAELGGLHVLGTERHESRRIDNQLRGRSGRQGDKGSSRFYLSLEDDLLRIFGAERISSLMDRIGFEEGQPIEHNLISKAVENAQKRVEGQNFDIRKHLLEYDDVMNKQRQVIYAERNQILDGKDIRGRVEEMIRDTVANTVAEFCPEKSYSEEWDWDGLADALNEITGASLIDGEVRGADTPTELTDALAGKVLALYQAKEAEIGEQQMRALERHVMLRVIDARWMNICWRWTICATASAYAPSASATRLWSTRPRRTRPSSSSCPRSTATSSARSYISR